MTLKGLAQALDAHLNRVGIRQVEHPTEIATNLEGEPIDNAKIINRIRKPISLSNGFRKHVISTFIEAGLNHEIRELW
jgi:hypothetical protein